MKDDGLLLASATLATSKPSRRPPTDLSNYTPEEKRQHLAELARSRPSQNGAVRNARVNAWKKANPEATRSHQLKYLYGITAAERDAILASQGFACAICNTDTPGKNGWLVDHCHATEKVRGVLCHTCNLLLGMAKDNPTTLHAAITYLGK